ncbi:hypothetical protein HMN09_00739100 [Mycena chlorophos]|uniref:DUF7918 domain-containing protein n=1 Tax=Mycena chlorophos TaxID=658473 RepID=A0A8H6W7J0_MYCCL|nr:hypothetical protein HMN09_00739100 [Mycena chlorophos]
MRVVLQHSGSKRQDASTTRHIQTRFPPTTTLPPAMPYHNGFSASILIDGREAKEYQLEYYGDEQTARTVSCYIAAELGQEFSIFWANEDYTDCMASRGTVTFYGNGDYTAREVIYRDDMLRMRSSRSREPASVTLHGDVMEDGKRFRPFTFSRLARTDDEDLVESGATDIGVIQLSIEGGWAEQDDTESAPDPSEDASDESDDDTIDVADEDPAEEPLPTLLLHEKIKKNHSQQISLAPARKIPKEQRVASSGDDLFSSATPHPIVIFRFLYRPLELLRAQGIAPPAAGQKKRKRDAAELERVKKKAQAQAKRHRGKHAQPAQAKTQTRAARPIVTARSPNSSAQDEHDDVARATTPPALQHSSASPRSTTPISRAASYSGAQGPTVKMEVDSEATSQAQSRSDANNAVSARINRMKALEAQRAKLDDEIAELKRDLPEDVTEDSDIGARKKRKIKSEGPSRSVFAPGEVIDLT